MSHLGPYHLSPEDKEKFSKLSKELLAQQKNGAAIEAELGDHTEYKKFEMYHRAIQATRQFTEGNSDGKMPTPTRRRRAETVKM